MESKLRTLQLTLASMLDQLDIFCREHNLPYYLIGGSTLGAVRHQGFIPWDDDVDVAMPRDIFERFEALAEGKKVGTLYYEPVEKHSFPEAPSRLFIRCVRPGAALTGMSLHRCFSTGRHSLLRRASKHSKNLFLPVSHLGVSAAVPKQGESDPEMITGAGLKQTPKFLFKFYPKDLQKKRSSPIGAPTSAASRPTFLGWPVTARRSCQKNTLEFPRMWNLKDAPLPIPEQADLYLRHLYGNYSGASPSGAAPATSHGSNLGGRIASCHRLFSAS